MISGGTVYAIANMDSGVAYVGSTMQASYKKRWEHHRWALRSRKHGNRYLQRAWDKYGAEVFRFVVLEHVTGSSADVLAREKQHLDSLRMISGVYNLALEPRRGPWYGKHLSEEHRARIGEGSKGKIISEAHKAAIGKAHLGMTHSKQSLAKIVRASRGNDKRAAPYPAFINVLTGEVIPAGINLARLCRDRALSRSGMSHLKNGSRECHMAWALLTQ